jgi:hypothetical protein
MLILLLFQEVEYVKTSCGIHIFRGQYISKNILLKKELITKVC